MSAQIRAYIETDRPDGFVFDFADVRFFSSQVRDYRPASAALLPALVLKAPSHAIGTDLRRAIRISVPPQSGLSVRAVSDAGGISPHPIDISLNGISVECAEGHDPEWSIGGSVRVQMSFEGSTVMLDAEVTSLARDAARGVAAGWPELAGSDQFFAYDAARYAALIAAAAPAP